MMVDAGKGNDRVFTSSGNDYVNAGEGNDLVATRGGTDVIDGGPGDDRLDGGTGINTLDYSKRTAGVSIDLGANSAGQAGETDRVDTSRSRWAERATTRSSDRPVNELHGNGGNDRLVASGDLDELFGGSGDDTSSTRRCQPPRRRRRPGHGGLLAVRALRRHRHRPQQGYAAGVGTRRDGRPGVTSRTSSARGTTTSLSAATPPTCLDGRGGPDTIVGKGGVDTLLGGEGNDYLEDRDNAVDQLTGGPGNDYAAPDLTYFPFGVSSRDTLNDVIEKVGEPKPIGM